MKLWNLKGGREMHNGIDKCANCGGKRVEGSTLCVDCLCACVIERSELERENKILKDTLSLSRRILSVVVKKHRLLQDEMNINKKEG